MKIKGNVIAKYPPISGEYMGQPWRNQAFVVAASETHPDTNIHDRIVIKVKGQKLNDFLEEGVQNGGLYEFDLYLDAEEKISKDGIPYPVNKAIVCVGFEKV